MTYTSQQSEAIYSHDRNVIVVAGAGSGKTRVLVARYLALLEQNPEWSLNALVAITFTQKAAQEMRDRVRSALQDRLKSAETPDIQERWSKLLAQMDSARIDTIHALCATILRANAAEAEIDPRFAIIEPVDADSLLQTVIDRVLSQLLQGDTPDPLLALFQHYDTKDIREVLAAFASEPLPNIPEAPEDILALWREQWEQNAERILSIESKSPVVANALAWAAASAPFPKGDKLAAQWDDACSALQMISAYKMGGSADVYIDALSSLANNIKLNVGSKKAWGSSDDKEEAKTQLGTVREWANQVMALIGAPPNEIDEAAATLIPLWVGLIRRVQQSYAAIKAADDVLDFNDLEQRATDLLERNPAVRARYLGSEFKHLLVDEFQDTNERQWAIIQALTAPEEPHDATARLFIVGDPKQSIYGFRGADVSVFGGVRQLLNDTAKPTGKTAEIALSHSFRTHQPLIAGFNHIFGQVLVKSPTSLVQNFEVEYGVSMTAHRETPPIDKPAIEITLIDTYERTPDGTDYICDDKGKPNQKINAEAARTWEAFEIATRIRQLVEEEQRLIYDKEQDITRPIAYADIVLLFQVTSNFGIYEDALRSQQIDYTTVAGRGYYSRQEVWDVLALLEALYNPYDDLALATALRSPLFNLSDEALFALRLRGDDATRYHLWDEIRCVANDSCPGPNVHLPADEHETVSAAWRILYALHALAGRVTISELLRAVMAQTGYLATLISLPDGARKRANVEKLLKKAVASGRVTLSAFTEYLSDLSDREVREGEAETEIRNAVTLMTVHASKGLEFPVVFLPDASWQRRNTGAPLLLSHPELGAACVVLDDEGKRQKPFAYNQITTLGRQFDEAERKRLFYVAATRAQDVLFISGQVQWDAKIGGWKTGGWMNWLLDALTLGDFAAEDGTQSYDWGDVRVHHPLYKLEATTKTRIVDAPAPLWENQHVLSGQPLGDEMEQPLLTKPVPVERQRFARNLTATQIADVGSAHYHPFYSERFRRSVTQNAPAQVKQVITHTHDKPVVPARILGEIVHEALRWWRFPDRENDMEAQLTSYAWKHGVVQPDDIRYAVNTARGWLRDMRYTDIYRWIDKSERVYRELPFVYQTDKRVIHGVIDVLFQRPDGTWAIVDYKSSLVHGYLERFDDAAERENRRLLEKHAERYHLQVGIYAAAVERYLTAQGEPLEPNQMAIFIHYLRYGHAVLVRHEQWATALSKLETQIGRLIEDTDET